MKAWSGKGKSRLGVGGAGEGMEWKRLIKACGLPGQGMELGGADEGMGIPWSWHGVGGADDGMETCLVKAWSGRG